MLSSRPQATVLGNGALLVTAGRPGLDLWISIDGFGQHWEKYSLPTHHNKLVASEGKPKAWGYCDAFVFNAANHTFAGDPTPRVDSKRDGGPVLGWMQTSGYNAVAPLDNNTALICYDRQGWGGGYYVSPCCTRVCVRTSVPPLMNRGCSDGMNCFNCMSVCRELTCRLYMDRKGRGRRGRMSRLSASLMCRTRTACA